jgi:DNA-binding IclR family transcriptional regulator
MFGLKLFSLANTALNGLQLREQAIPHLYSLMQQTRLTTHMAVLEQNEAVLVAKVEGPSSPKLATWIGKRMEPHCTGLGKALIAHLPEPRLDELLKEHALPRHNENTLASVKRLKEDLAKAVKLGYAIDDEEDEIGLRCIGAPIFDRSGSVIAAISIAGTTSQITAENVHHLAQLLKNTGTAVSRTLAHVGG